MRRLLHCPDWHPEERSQLACCEENMPGGKEHQFVTTATLFDQRATGSPILLCPRKALLRTLYKHPDLLHRLTGSLWSIID
jgi:hypothetical protein